MQGRKVSLYPSFPDLVPRMDSRLRHCHLQYRNFANRYHPRYGPLYVVFGQDGSHGHLKVRPEPMGNKGNNYLFSPQTSANLCPRTFSPTQTTASQTATPTPTKPIATQTSRHEKNMPLNEASRLPPYLPTLTNAPAPHLSLHS